MKGRPQPQKHHRHDGGDGDEDDVDPFDVSDDEDAVKFVKLPSEKPVKLKSKTTEAESSKSKKRKHDEEEGAASGKKSSKKSKKKEPESESEDEAEHKKSKKHSNLSKGVKDKLEQDEAEIAYLEKKLGIKGNKTPKSFDEDGLDFLLEGLDKDFLSGDDDEEEAGGDELAAYRREKAAKRKANMEAENEEEENESDEDDMSDGLDGLADGYSDEEEGELGDFYTDDEERDESDEGDDDDSEEFKGFSDTESEPKSTGTPPPEEPSARTRPDPTKPFVASAAKYVPPSRRAALAPAATESEAVMRLRRSTQGLLNRFSEANLLSILTAIETTYRDNPRGDVNNVLTDIILSTICDKSSLLDTFIILYGGFVAGVYKLIGTDFGGNIVQKAVEQFEKYHAQSNGLGVEDNAGKEATNLMTFLAELYNFGVISSVLIFDYIRRFLSELTELHTELLLKIVRNSGPQLRSDDPTALKSLVALLQTSITKAGGPEKLSIRTKFMVETLTNLKNNKLKNMNASGAAVTAEATTRMRKLLGTLNTRRLRATEPLRASLDDITNADKRGKWWLVGASWAGRSDAPSTSAVELPDPDQLSGEEESDHDDELDGFDTSALMPQLIHQHRLNTPSRRAIFTTLLTATDFQDCTNRLLALRLPRSQLPEISRLTVHCAISEGVYNPYYTVLATHLSQSSKPVRTAFLYTLYEQLDRIAELKLPQVVVLGRLYAGMVIAGIMTVGQCAKTIERWKFVEGQVRAFLEVFLGTVVKDENVWWEGQGLEGEMLEGVGGALERWDKGITKAAGGGSEGKARVKKVRKTLSDMRRRVLLGDDDM